MRIDKTKHADMLAWCEENKVTAACLLSSYIDALLSGDAEPLVKGKIKNGGWEGQCEKHTVLRRAPNGYRRERIRRTTDRTNLRCEKGCNSLFQNASAVISHEQTCLGSMEKNRAHRMWWGKVRWHRNNERRDKLGNRIYCNLTFDDYYGLLQEANITAFDVGQGADRFVLGRYRDIGHYEVGNCRFISPVMNLYENHYSTLLVKTGKNPNEIPLDSYIKGLERFADACRAPL